MAGQAIKVAHRGCKGARIAALPLGQAVTTSVPCLEAVIIQPELFDNMRDTAAMFVTAMQKNDGTFRLFAQSWPVAEKDFLPVMADKMPLSAIAFYRSHRPVFHMAIYI